MLAGIQVPEGEEPAMVPEPIERDEELDLPSMEDVAAETAAGHVGAAVQAGLASIEDMAAMEDLVDLIAAESKRVRGRGSRGGRGRGKGSGSRENAAAQGGQGRGKGRGKGRGRGQKASEPMELSEETTSSEEEDVEMEGGDE